jgi:hypothetical protein
VRQELEENPMDLRGLVTRSGIRHGRLSFPLSSVDLAPAQQDGRCASAGRGRRHALPGLGQIGRSGLKFAFRRLDNLTVLRRPPLELLEPREIERSLQTEPIDRRASARIDKRKRLFGGFNHGDDVRCLWFSTQSV